MDSREEIIEAVSASGRLGYACGRGTSSVSRFAAATFPKGEGFFLVRFARSEIPLRGRGVGDAAPTVRDKERRPDIPAGGEKK